MKPFLNFLGGVIMMTGLYGFFFMFGYLWDHREMYEFGVGVLALIGWTAIGVLIVKWVYGLAYPKK